MNPRRPDSLIMFTGSLWGTWNPKGSLINWVYFCLVELYAYRHAWMTCCDGGSKGVNPGGNFRLKEVSRWAFGLFHCFFKNLKVFSCFLEFLKFCTNFLQFIIIIRNYQTLYGGILRNEGKKLIQIITLRFSTTVTPSIIYILHEQ